MVSLHFVNRGSPSCLTGDVVSPCRRRSCARGRTTNSLRTAPASRCTLGHLVSVFPSPSLHFADFRPTCSPSALARHDLHPVPPSPVLPRPRSAARLCSACILHNRCTGLPTWIAEDRGHAQQPTPGGYQSRDAAQSSRVAQGTDYRCVMRAFRLPIQSHMAIFTARMPSSGVGSCCTVSLCPDHRLTPLTCFLDP